MMHKPIIAVLAALSMAGCAAPTAPGMAASPPAASIVGQVLDVEFKPVAGATITAEPNGETTISSESGSFALVDLDAGNVTLTVEHEGFEPATAALTLAAGEEVRYDFRLVPLPKPVSRDETFVFRGNFDCGFELLIIGQDCLVLYENLTGNKDPITNESNAFRLLVKPGWETIYLNLTWDSGAENQLDGMRLNLEHGNGSTTGHAYQIAQVGGTEQPLELFVERGTPHPSADFYDGTSTPAMISDEGEETQVRVFPRGKMTETFGMICSEPQKCFLGAGIGLDIRFEVHAVVHYAA